MVILADRVDLLDAGRAKDRLVEDTQSLWRDGTFIKGTNFDAVSPLYCITDSAVWWHESMESGEFKMIFCQAVGESIRGSPPTRVSHSPLHTLMGTPDPYLYSVIERRRRQNSSPSGAWQLPN